MPDVNYVRIDTIPHGRQRYDTIGDWVYYPSVKGYTSTGTVKVLTSELGDWRMSMCCAVHELVETLLCVNDGVDEVQVSAFDTLYEEVRVEVLRLGFIPVDLKAAEVIKSVFGCDCIPTEESEPGEDRHAPYRKQHAFADGIERLLANQLGVVWDEYAEIVTGLDYEKEKAKYADAQKERSEEGKAEAGLRGNAKVLKGEAQVLKREESHGSGAGEGNRHE